MSLAGRQGCREVDQQAVGGRFGGDGLVDWRGQPLTAKPHDRAAPPRREPVIVSRSPGRAGRRSAVQPDRGRGDGGDNLDLHRRRQLDPPGRGAVSQHRQWRGRRRAVDEHGRGLVGSRHAVLRLECCPELGDVLHRQRHRREAGRARTGRARRPRPTLPPVRRDRGRRDRGGSIALPRMRWAITSSSSEAIVVTGSAGCSASGGRHLFRTRRLATTATPGCATRASGCGLVEEDVELVGPADCRWALSSGFAVT